MTRKDHKEIYEQLSFEMQAAKFRRQQELNEIGKPRIADFILGWIFTIVAVTGIVVILMYINNK